MSSALRRDDVCCHCPVFSLGSIPSPAFLPHFSVSPLSLVHPPYSLSFSFLSLRLSFFSTFIYTFHFFFSSCPSIISFPPHLHLYTRFHHPTPRLLVHHSTFPSFSLLRLTFCAILPSPFLCSHFCTVSQLHCLSFCVSLKIHVPHISGQNYPGEENYTTWDFLPHKSHFALLLCPAKDLLRLRWNFCFQTYLVIEALREVLKEMLATISPITLTLHTPPQLHHHNHLFLFLLLPLPPFLFSLSCHVIIVPSFKCRVRFVG